MKTHPVKMLLFFASFFLLSWSDVGRQAIPAVKSEAPFPTELVAFSDYEKNPVFEGTGSGTWDSKIRERGWILKEDGLYHLWYTGYRKKESEEKHLGYATSPDGLVWTRYSEQPIYDKGWVEDMCVIRSGITYYMFAEGRHDIAHLLTSTDRIHWQEQGPLEIHQTNGELISAGAYGTPTVWLENGTWHLFYERGDLGIWLATSSDGKVWTNEQDEPVLKNGPELYDFYAVAFDQVFRYKGVYYAYYHATAEKDWSEWTTNIARSNDLIHWEKFSGNPIVRNNRSSPQLVHDGKGFRLYTMHQGVFAHFSIGR